MSGCCKLGDDCAFSHDWTAGPNMICRYYLAGNCVYGDKCRYDHIKPGNNQNEPKSSGYKPPQIPKPQSQQPNNKSKAMNFNAVPWQPLSNKNSQSQTSTQEYGQDGQYGEFYEGYYDYQEEEEYEEDDEDQQFNPWSMKQALGESLPPDPAELPLCTEYQVMGSCAKDEDCPYIHGDFCDICEKFALHPYNEEQQAEHVMECSLRHKHVQARMKSAEVECGICLEKVLSKTDPAERKFGLMTCDHSFCLNCIRNWRQQGEKDGIEVDAVRSCPMCRCATHFITPSTTWPQTQEEKDTIISGYKNKLASMDCKHFDFGKGKCPFGVSCFYRHAFENGALQDREKALRKSKNAEGEIKIIQEQTLSSFLDTPQVERLLRRRR
eukprot:TRINITY_DN689_c0_g3_i1.p1 TRINITY_DN689_c0_g3~~TRINITY_DN689_c0_g3_i1.p1  ORF type:complete len:381 (-),score=45.35 TRINITY_DN689_c0_g3_i1:372-1514(-)